MLDDEERHLISFGQYGEWGAFSEKLCLQSSQCLVVQVARTGEFFHAPWLSSDCAEGEMLILPVVFRRQTIGVFQLFGRKNHVPLKDSEIEQIRIFLRSIACTLQLGRKREILEKLKKQKESLLEASLKISSTIELPELLDLLGREVKKVPGAVGYYIFLVDETKTHLVLEKAILPPGFEQIEKVLEKNRFPVEAEEPYARCF